MVSKAYEIQDGIIDPFDGVFKPPTTEDGLVTCNHLIANLELKPYQPRVIEFGSGKYPVNLYDDSVPGGVEIGGVIQKES
jgi:hypothetical protein